MQENTSPISVLVVDDHSFVRQSLQKLLNIEADIKVVGKAKDGSEALRLATELEPDVIVLDVTMSESDGLGLLRELTVWRRAPAVVVARCGRI